MSASLRTYITKMKGETIEAAIAAYESFPFYTSHAAKNDAIQAGFDEKDFEVLEVTVKKVGVKNATKRPASKKRKRSSN